MSRDEAKLKEIVKSYLDKGYSGWMWEQMVLDMLPHIGHKTDGRPNEIASFASSTLRGVYRFGAKSWGLQKWDENIDRIVQLVDFETSFTLKSRPKPEKDFDLPKGMRKREKAEAKDGTEVPSKEAIQAKAAQIRDEKQKREMAISAK